MSKKSPFAPLTPAELRACARTGAIAHLEDLARRVRAAFPELHVAVMITDARFAPPTPIVRGSAVDVVGPRRRGRRPRIAVETETPRRRKKFSAAARARIARAMRKRWRVAKRNGRTSLAAKSATTGKAAE